MGTVEHHADFAVILGSIYLIGVSILAGHDTATFDRGWAYLHHTHY